VSKFRKDISWLPELILLEDYNGDWEKYNDALYEIFRNDFIINKQIFKKMPVSIKTTLTNGKEETFWHITSEKGELERCKRIKWPKAILDNYSDSVIRIWRNERPRGRYNVLLWLAFDNNDEYDYLVVLGERKGYFHFITAYTIEFSHRKRKLMKEYLEYIDKGL